MAEQIKSNQDKYKAYTETQTWMQGCNTYSKFKEIN